MSALLNLKQKASSIDFSLESSNWWFKPLTTIWALRYSGLNDNVATLGFMKLYFTRICKITLICLSRDFSLHLLGDVVISCIKEKDKNSHSLAHTANHQMQLWKDIFSSLHRWDFLPHVNWLLLTKKYVIHHVHTHPQYSKPYMFVPSFSELCWPIHFFKNTCMCWTDLFCKFSTAFPSSATDSWGYVIFWSNCLQRKNKPKAVLCLQAYSSLREKR